MTKPDSDRELDTASLVGGMFAGCRVVEQLGDGGIGAVYRARNPRLEADVCLRVVSPKIASGEELARDFVRQGVAAAQLKHIGIVPIEKIGYDEQQDLYYMLSEFVRGRTLADALERDGPMSPETVVGAALQICDALAAAHDADVLHRSLHPGQFLVTAAGRVRVTDFGLLRMVHTSANMAKAVGDPQFMAPEQFEGKGTDHRADIFSLGTTLFTLLTGRPPFVGANTVQTIYAILTEEPTPLTDLRPDVPLALAAIVHRMLAKSPDDRYPDVRTLASELETLFAQVADGRWECVACAGANDAHTTTCLDCGGGLLPRLRIAPPSRFLVDNASETELPDVLIDSSPDDSTIAPPASDTAPSEMPTMCESEGPGEAGGEGPTQASSAGGLSSDLGLRFCDRVVHDGEEHPSLGGFILLREIGRGGMGVVYFGHDPGLARDVAVKVLPAGHRRAEEEHIYAQRFMREARLAARVSSPHVVGVHTFGFDLTSQIRYLVMPFIDGSTARQWADGLRSSSEVPEADALTVCIAATTGLVDAHASAIVHRDVKPSNILIPRSSGGDVQLDAAMLADLGLARPGGEEPSLTATGQGMGTPGYMSPEQIGDATAVNETTDVFGMGATLYALLAGVAPFKSSGNWVMNTVSGTYPAVTEIRPDVSSETRALIARSLQFEPTARFPDAMQLLGALRAARSRLR